jgi:DNA-binding response OmpR family regulator
MSDDKKRILCLEDDPDTCELVKILLGTEGFEVIAVSTLEDALQLTEEIPFVVYIVDQHLPGGAGIDFIRQIRQSGDHTPVLVHSAAAYKRDIDAAMAAGADEYLVKPNGWTKLSEAVNALLQNK